MSEDRPDEGSAPSEDSEAHEPQSVERGEGGSATDLRQALVARQTLLLVASGIAFFVVAFRGIATFPRMDGATPMAACLAAVVTIVSIAILLRWQERATPEAIPAWVLDFTRRGLASAAESTRATLIGLMGISVAGCVGVLFTDTEVLEVRGAPPQVVSWRPLGFLFPADSHAFVGEPGSVALTAWSPLALFRPVRTTVRCSMGNGESYDPVEIGGLQSCSRSGFMIAHDPVRGAPEAVKPDDHELAESRDGPLAHPAYRDTTFFFFADPALRNRTGRSIAFQVRYEIPTDPVSLDGLIGNDGVVWVRTMPPPASPHAGAGFDGGVPLLLDGGLDGGPVDSAAERTDAGRRPLARSCTPRVGPPECDAWDSDSCECRRCTFPYRPTGDLQRGGGPAVSTEELVRGVCGLMPRGRPVRVSVVAGRIIRDVNEDPYARFNGGTVILEANGRRESMALGDRRSDLPLGSIIVDTSAGAGRVVEVVLSVEGAHSWGRFVGESDGIRGVRLSTGAALRVEVVE